MLQSNIQPPVGFPYILYGNNQGKMFGVASSEQQMYSKYHLPKQTKLKPVNLLSLISKHGHNDVNRMLKQFGTEWIAKAGTIYYKPSTGKN